MLMSDIYKLITSVDTVSTGYIVSDEDSGVQLMIKSSQTDIKGKVSHSFLNNYTIDDSIIRTNAFPIQCDDMKVIVPSPSGRLTI